MRPPFPTPIGLRLANVAKAVGRAFDETLAAAGGSRPVWLILISLKTSSVGNQRELASAVGIEGATLTHHLDSMESEGLVTRRRDPANRRVQVVELTERGESAFHAMRGVAMDFDRRLRAGLSQADMTRLVELLNRLRENVAGGAKADPQA